MLGDIIHFELDRPRVRRIQLPVVQNVAEFLNANSDIRQIEVDGHADELWSRRLQPEPLREARGGRQVLLLKFGVREDRVTTQAYGESKPKVLGHAEASLRQNRRVEFLVIPHQRRVRRALCPNTESPKSASTPEQKMSHASSTSLIRVAATLLVSSGTIASALVGCGESNALVGGECAPGFEQCDFACVDSANDPDNCGGCGIVCRTGMSCVASTCVAPGDQHSDAGTVGSSTDGGTPGTGSPPSDDAGGGPTGADDASGPTGSDDAGGPTGSDSGGSSSNDGGTVTDGQTDSGDASGHGGSSDAGAGSDANTGSDAAPPVDASGSDADASQCMSPPPFDTAAHCGDCFTSCKGTNDTCVGDADAGYSCVPLCAAPLTECSGQCFDEQNDPNNCGTCNKVCLSGLCSAGLCEGETPGDDIVIGHDYSSATPGTAQARALSNAVFLPSSNPVRILSFEEYADPGAVAAVKAILTAAGAADGKSIQWTISTNDGDVPASLNMSAFDTLLVYDQTTAPSGQLASLGTSWASTLATFLDAGGDVITLDGASGTTMEMPLFESAAGLLSVTSHTAIAPATPLSVVAPRDSVAVGVLSPYGAAKSSAYFTTLEGSCSNVTYVVVEPVSGNPVIVHKTVEKSQQDAGALSPQGTIPGCSVRLK